MRVSVDTAGPAVRSGDSAWPFRVDVRRNCAIIALDGVEYSVRPQSWQEKIRMSRFIGLGESFLQSSFLECCVPGGERLDAERREIVLALAMWINRPDEDTPGLPLDARQLARVTLEVCRSMSVGPAAIADLAAPEVESLWRSLDRESGWDGADRSQSPQQQFDTKIVVLPDAARAQTSGTPPTPPPAAEPQPGEPQPGETHAAEAPLPEPAEPKPEAEKTGEPRKNTRRPAASTPQARFRVSFNTAVFEARRASQPTRPQPLSTEPKRPAPPSGPPGEPRTPASGSRDPFFRTPPPPAPVAAESHESALQEWQPLLPATPTASEAPHHIPSPAAAGDPDVAPAFAPVRQVAPMESLLDEFCQRLDEAAADLGILEEA